MKLNRYRIFNFVLKEFFEVKAGTSLAAVEMSGWPLDECRVKQYSDVGSGGWKNPDDLPWLGSRRRKL